MGSYWLPSPSPFSPYVLFNLSLSCVCVDRRNVLGQKRTGTNYPARLGPFPVRHSKFTPIALHASWHSWRQLLFLTRFVQIVPVIPFALTTRVGVPEQDGTFQTHSLIQVFQILIPSLTVQHWVSVLLAVYGASLLGASRMSSPFLSPHSPTAD